MILPILISDKYKPLYDELRSIIHHVDDLGEKVSMTRLQYESFQAMRKRLCRLLETIAEIDCPQPIEKEEPSNEKI